MLANLKCRDAAVDRARCRGQLFLQRLQQRCSVHSGMSLALLYRQPLAVLSRRVPVISATAIAITIIFCFLATIVKNS